MKVECIFFIFLNGEIPSKKIYEDENVLAFLDINPSSPGHTLVVPKRHILDFQEIDDDDLLNLMKICKNLSKKIVSVLDADGYSILQNNGIAQDVKHFHLHIIPKYSNDKTMDIDEVYKKITNE